jgi:hypothetical protein
MATAEKTKTPPERTKLREAIAACDCAKADVERAEKMLHGAHSMLTKLLGKQSDFARLVDEMSNARAANLKAAIMGEDTLWRDDPSGRFAERLEARDRLEEEIGAMRQTIPTLEAELEAAKRNVETKLYQIDLAAERVFATEADALARDYLDALAQVRSFSNQLWFMANVQVKNDPTRQRAVSNAPVYYGNEVMRKIAMTGHVADACRENPHGDHDLRGGIALRQRMSKAVSSYWLRLHSDPRAQLEVEEPPKPFDPSAMERACEAAGLRTSRSYEPGSMS